MNSIVTSKLTELTGHPEATDNIALKKEVVYGSSHPCLCFTDQRKQRVYQLKL